MGNDVLEAMQSQRPPLSAVLEAVQSQVPQTAERERVLDALRHLASGANQKVVRSLAGQWEVRQKVGRDNRGTAAIRNEVEDNVRRAAMRLLEKEGPGEDGAGAVAGEEDATMVRVNQSGREARPGKKRRMPEPEPTDKSVPEARDDVSLSLQAARVVEAISILDTLPAGGRVDEVRGLLLQWRTGAALRRRKRPCLLKVAVEFGIPLPRGFAAQTQKILSAIAEVFIINASALRFGHAAAGSGVSAARAVGLCPPIKTE